MILIKAYRSKFIQIDSHSLIEMTINTFRGLFLERFVAYPLAEKDRLLSCALVLQHINENKYYEEVNSANL